MLSEAHCSRVVRNEHSATSLGAKGLYRQRGLNNNRHLGAGQAPHLLLVRLCQLSHHPWENPTLLARRNSQQHHPTLLFLRCKILDLLSWPACNGIAECGKASWASSKTEGHLGFKHVRNWKCTFSMSAFELASTPSHQTLKRAQKDSQSRRLAFTQALRNSLEGVRFMSASFFVDVSDERAYNTSNPTQLNRQLRAKNMHVHRKTSDLGAARVVFGEFA